MAKKFSELRDKMPAHARELAHQKAQDELARLNQPLEPDLVDWLKVQNDDIKSYVNNMVRGVMNVQQQALKGTL